MNEVKRMLSTRVSPNVIREAKKKAIDEEVSLEKLVERALWQYLVPMKKEK